MSSNDYRQIRGYVNTRMAIVEPTFSEWTDSLAEIGNIPRTKLDRAYQVNIGAATSTTQIDRHVSDLVNVVISVFRQGFNNATQTRDDLLQVANCIRLDMINPLNIEEYKRANDGNIEDVISVSITPSEIAASNDNILKVEIELNLRLLIGTT